MNARMVARNRDEEPALSLSERIARFATAVNGCSARYASKSHWKAAKRELAGEPDTDADDSVPESALESAPWATAPGSTGQDAPAARPGIQAG